MTASNTGPTPSALSVFAQTFWSSFRGRFRKGDAVHIPLVGITLGLAMFLGEWAVAYALGFSSAASASVANVMESIVIGMVMAVVLAALQVWDGGITIFSTLSAWAVILVALAAGVWTQRQDRVILANAAVIALSSLGALLWLLWRRGYRAQSLPPRQPTRAAQK